MAETTPAPAKDTTAAPGEDTTLAPVEDTTAVPTPNHTKSNLSKPISAILSVNEKNQ